MSVMSGGEYDEPLEEFNEVFTNPDELLGMLESCLDPFEAKKTLCDIFQVNTGMDWRTLTSHTDKCKYDTSRPNRRSTTDGWFGVFWCRICGRS